MKNEKKNKKKIKIKKNKNNNKIKLTDIFFPHSLFFSLVQRYTYLYFRH